MDNTFMADEILLQAIAEGFAAVDKRFDIVDQRFKEVDQRFETIDKRFEGIDKRFDAIDTRLDNMVTKTEFREFAHQNTAQPEPTAEKLNTISQEPLFAYHAVKRLENEISRIKVLLNIA